MRWFRTARVAWAAFLVPCMLALILGNGSPASANSRVLWQRIFSRPGGSNAALAVSTAPDGSAIYVMGVLFDPKRHAEGIETIAYDPADGDTLWEARYFGSGGSVSPITMTVSPDGGTVFVTGETHTDATAADWDTVAYDASDGAQRWVATYGGAEPQGNDNAYALAVSPDSRTLVVTGVAWQGTHPKEVPTTIAYDTSTGATRWTAWDDTAPYGVGQYIAVSPDGSRVDVTAAFAGDAGTLRLTRTYSYDAASGDEAWSATFRGGPPGSVPSGMTLAPDGSHVYLAAGVLTGKLALVSYDASTGVRAWKVQTAGPLGLGAAASGIAVTPDGSRILLGGQTNRWAKRTAAFLWSVDAATGTPQWRRAYQRAGDAYDATTAMTISPDGSTAYVFGIGCVDARCDDFSRAWQTLAYSLPDGAFQWSARFLPPDTDNRAMSIAVTPDSTKVVVVGDRYSKDADTDSFATIVYAA